MSSEEWWSRALGLSRAPIVDAPVVCVPTWSGDITVRARGRYTEDDADTDLYQHFRVRYRREDAPGWSASMHLRLSEDLDGIADSSDFFVFDSVDDTYDTAILSRLYHLYAHYHAPGGVLDYVRIGRQDVTAGEIFHVDGATVSLRPSPCGSARLFAFGGIPSHLYESTIDGDWIVGVGGSFSPWRGASVEASDVYLEDHSEIYGTPTANLFTVEMAQRFANGGLRAGYQHLDEEARKAWGSFDWFVPRWAASFRGTLHVQILSEEEQAYDIDPYYAILLDLQPYWDLGLSASKELGRCASVEAGVQLRRLFEDDDEGAFNHEFTRVYGTLATQHRPWYGLGLAVTGEWWSAEDTEDVVAAGFEVDYRPGGRWRWTAGMDYALYRTDLYAAEERYDSYGWYLRARYDPSPRWHLDGRLRVDTDDFDTYLTVDLAALWEF
jgi:hypothetical protein